MWSRIQYVCVCGGIFNQDRDRILNSSCGGKMFVGGYDLHNGELFDVTNR